MRDEVVVPLLFAVLAICSVYGDSSALNMGLLHNGNPAYYTFTGQNPNSEAGVIEQHLEKGDTVKIFPKDGSEKLYRTAFDVYQNKLENGEPINNLQPNGNIIKRTTEPTLTPSDYDDILVQEAPEKTCHNPYNPFHTKEIKMLYNALMAARDQANQSKLKLLEAKRLEDEKKVEDLNKLLDHAKAEHDKEVLHPTEGPGVIAGRQTINILTFSKAQPFVAHEEFLHKRINQLREENAKMIQQARTAPFIKNITQEVLDANVGKSDPKEFKKWITKTINDGSVNVPLVNLNGENMVFKQSDLLPNEEGTNVLQPVESEVKNEPGHIHTKYARVDAPASQNPFYLSV